MRLRDDRAFTIIEILTSVAVSTMLFLSVVALFIMANKFYTTNILQQSLQRDAEIVLSKIIKGKTEPGGIFRLSEAVTFTQVSISEFHFFGTDGKERWYKLGAGNSSITYHHTTAAGVKDETIYSAPQNSTLTLRFWIPAGINYTGMNVGVDVGIQKSLLGRTISGSATTLVNIRNHPS